MLLKLTVRNYALIRELDLSLEKGLTIITGETGAGKSILLGALSLILGSRADSAVLLDKSEKCVIEGSFNIEGYELEDFFKSNELDFENPALLRREINPAGKSRAFINDTPVTVNLLKELGDRLIDIHSQHQTLMLNDNSFQLSVIDSYSGTAELLSHYRTAFSDYRIMRKEYSELKSASDKSKADLEYFQFHLAQLEEAKLKSGEQDDLEREQELLEHAEEIKLSLITISQLFSSEKQSVIGSLREIRNIVSRIGNFLPPDLNIAERINSALIELDDLSSEIERIEQNTDADPLRLQKINERLDTIYSLVRKHKVKDIDELILKRDEISNLIKSLVTGDERLIYLEAELKVRQSALESLCERISAKRRSSLPEIETKITGILRNLGIPNARFRIALSKTGDFTITGKDIADFHFSANKQIEPENIARIASGGELSRVMLSLKSLISKNNNLPTIIFDEIDSGVSGEVADKVGQILSGMGKYMQVINITHLPQVASRGKVHYHVYKEDVDDSTITRIRLLSHTERVQEVARLLSGSEVTEAAVKNARELIASGTK